MAAVCSSSATCETPTQRGQQTVSVESQVAGGQRDRAQFVPAAAQGRGRGAGEGEDRRGRAAFPDRVVAAAGRRRGTLDVDGVGPRLAGGLRQVGEGSAAGQTDVDGLALRGGQRPAEVVVGRRRDVAHGVGFGEHVFLGVVDRGRHRLQEADGIRRGAAAVTDRQRAAGVQNDRFQQDPIVAQDRGRGVGRAARADRRVGDRVVGRRRRRVKGVDVERPPAVGSEVAEGPGGRCAGEGIARRAGDGGDGLALGGGGYVAAGVVAVGGHVAVGIGDAGNQPRRATAGVAQGRIDVARDGVAAVGRVLALVVLVGRAAGPRTVDLLFLGEQVAAGTEAVDRLLRGRGGVGLRGTGEQIDRCPAGGIRLASVGPRLLASVGQRFGSQVAVGVVRAGRDRFRGIAVVMQRRARHRIGLVHRRHQAVGVAVVDRHTTNPQLK